MDPRKESLCERLNVMEWERDGEEESGKDVEYP